jgi:hypothetical protein
MAILEGFGSLDAISSLVYAMKYRNILVEASSLFLHV